VGPIRFHGTGGRSGPRSRADRRQRTPREDPAVRA
jgi:hypothetical protein